MIKDIHFKLIKVMISLRSSNLFFLSKRWTFCLWELGYIWYQIIKHNLDINVQFGPISRQFARLNLRYFNKSSDEDRIQMYAMHSGFESF